MTDLRARWVFTVGILYLRPEGRRSCKKWVGSDKILVAFAVFLTGTIVPDWYRVYKHSDFARNFVYSV